MQRLKLLALIAGLAMVAAACGTDTDSSDSPQTSESDVGQGDERARLSVVVTTSIWGDIVSNVTGDNADVEVLFPLGADPHDAQLSSAQVASMQEADLVVVNGLALEEGILDVVEGLEADGANVLEIAGLIDPIPFGEGGHADDEHDEHDEHDEDGEDHDEDADHADEDEDGEHSDDDHDDDEHHDEMTECDAEAGHGEHEDEGADADSDGHDHGEGSCDPHIWMDPLRVADAVEHIAEELTALDDSVDWMANASAYADQLRAVDAEIVTLLSAVPDERRKLVTNHDAFGYFAERYGFEIVGTVIPSGSTLADPSSAELAALVDVMMDENINAVFAETIEPSALADAVAAEIADAAVVELFTGSLGEAGSGAETYVDFVRTNATLITDALS